MRHIGIALLVVTMVVGFTAVAQAQHRQRGEGGQYPPPWQEGHRMVARAVGQVTGISGNTLTISATVNGQAQVVVVTFDRRTHFGAAQEGNAQSQVGAGSQGNAVTSADVLVGETVKVYYTVGDDVAETVIIISAPAGAGDLT